MRTAQAEMRDGQIFAIDDYDISQSIATCPEG